MYFIDKAVNFVDKAFVFVDIELIFVDISDFLLIRWLANFAILGFVHKSMNFVRNWKDFVHKISSFRVYQLISFIMPMVSALIG
ncbi:hypothetical protein HPK19_02195 [Arthrobacter citreus]|nr:hypothetical protein HPK19_02195 [Arthrobacter citreus]